jgi:tetratricopeptide (TPR) repeat protein
VFVLAPACKRKEEAPAKPAVVRPVVEGVEAKVAEHLAQGRLCRRVYGTALAVGRPMCTETAKVIPKPPALLEYYAAMMALEAGDLETARKGFAHLANADTTPTNVREWARLWRAACEGAPAQLPRADPKAAPRLASEAGRARAFLKTDLPEAERLCVEAVKCAPSKTDLQALNLNYAIVLVANGRADEAKKALDAVNPQLPIDECDVEKIKLPGRELQRTMRFYDPALLKCWADYHFLKAVGLGENAPQARVRLDVASALWYLGRVEEAEKRLKVVFEVPSLSSQDRLAALALYGQVLWSRGQEDAAHKTWDEMGTNAEETVVFLLQAYGDVPGLPVAVLEKGIGLGQETLKQLRQKESEYSDRRFRERHLDLFWALGWLCCTAGMERASQGDLARASEHLANAEEIGNRLYEESSRFDLERNPPLFLAELADVYLLNVLALGRGNAYLEDMLRYMYDENMLPKVLPAAWQVREYAQMLYALRDLSARSEAGGRKASAAPAPPTMYKSLMAAAQPPPAPASARRPAPVNAGRVVLAAAVVVLACVVAALLVWRRRRQKEFHKDLTD